MPFLFVSLGECLTEKSGRINLGLEGVLVLSAMAAFGGAYLTGSPWARRADAARWHGRGAGHCCTACCARWTGVNDVATGIALMMLGTGLAFYFGKPLIQPQAPQIPFIALGAWSDSSGRARRRLQINALLPLGLLLARRCGGALPARAGACWCAWPATRPMPRARWAIRSRASASRPRRPAASSPGWVAPR